jgi:hypothetical protein
VEKRDGWDADIADGRGFLKGGDDKGIARSFWLAATSGRRTTDQPAAKERPGGFHGFHGLRMRKGVYPDG